MTVEFKKNFIGKSDDNSVKLRPIGEMSKSEIIRFKAVSVAFQRWMQENQERIREQIEEAKKKQ